MKHSWPQRARSVWCEFGLVSGGATAIEYAMIAGGLAVLIVGTVYLIGSDVLAMYLGVLPGLS